MTRLISGKSVVVLVLVLSSQVPLKTWAQDGGARAKLQALQQREDSKSNNVQNTGANYALGLTNRDDYHSNINLNDMITDSSRYSSLDGRAGLRLRQQPMWFTSFQRIPIRSSRNTYSVERENELESAYSPSHGALSKIRQHLAGLERGERDYSVGIGAHARPRPEASPRQDSAMRAELWATDIIGGLLQDQQKQRAQQKR